MRIVAAGMHYSDCLAVEFSGFLGRERKRISLSYRKSVHIGPEPDDRSGLLAFKNSYDTCLSDPGPHFNANRAEPVGNEFRGIYLAVRQLRMLMDISSPLDDLRQNFLSGRVDLCTHIDGK